MSWLVMQHVPQQRRCMGEITGGQGMTGSVY
jgi:hypothetical protein